MDQRDATRSLLGDATARILQFIMGPVNQLMPAIMNDDKPKYEKMMDNLGIMLLKGDEKALRGKPLMKHSMQIWINAVVTLLSMIVTKLPPSRTLECLFTVRRR